MRFLPILTLLVILGCCPSKTDILPKQDPFWSDYLDRTIGKCYKGWTGNVVHIEKKGKFFKSEQGAVIVNFIHACDDRDPPECVTVRDETTWVRDGECLYKYISERYGIPIKCPKYVLKKRKVKK